MTTHNPLRVAVAGAGMIARVHLDAIRRAGATVVGLSASTPARAAAAAAQAGVPRAYDSSEQLADDPGVDVVHLCTPNHLHAPLVRRALAAGKHVVCEKPLATSGAEAGELAALARQSGMVCAVPFVYRYHPLAAEARSRVRGGRAGDVRLIHGHYLQDWLSTSSDANWRVDPLLGGPSRAFADIGAHWCDLVEWVSGHRITELVASVRTVLPERAGTGSRTFTSSGAAPPDSGTFPVTTEDTVQVLFHTDRGADGAVTVSQVSPGRKNRLWFEIDGATTSLVFDQEQPETLFVGSRAGNAVVPRDPATLSPTAAALSTLPAGHPMGYHDCFAGFVRDVYGAVRRGSAAGAGFPTFDDAARAARLTDEVLASARTRSWREVS